MFQNSDLEQINTNIVATNELLQYLYDTTNGTNEQEYTFDQGAAKFELIPNSDFGFGGVISGGTFINSNAYPVFLKFYNYPADQVTVGVSVPFYKVQVGANGMLVLDSIKAYADIPAWATPSERGLTVACTKFSPTADNTAIGTPLECFLRLIVG